LGERRSRYTHGLVLALTNVVALGCLFWTLRDAHLSELKDDLATMNWGWVAVAVVADVAVYFWHGLRWILLLRPVVRARYQDAVRSIYVGLFANEILPLRAGELLRCYLLGRLAHLPISVSVASALIERVFDGIWLCLCLVVTLSFVPIPRQLHFLVDGAYVLTITVLAGAVILGVALFQRYRNRAAREPGEGWRHQLAVLMDDLGLIGHSRYLVVAFFQSLPYLLLQVIPIWATFRGYGFDLSIGAAFALMVLLRLGSAVPQAPGNLGLFQFLTKECLEHIFNVVPDEAARFSLVLWGVVTLPLLIGGFIAADFTGAHLGDLREAAKQEVTDARRASEA
jgi:uncharacterized membrane protein YbhN (UPF0104 family)